MHNSHPQTLRRVVLATISAVSLILVTVSSVFACSRRAELSIGRKAGVPHQENPIVGPSARGGLHSLLPSRGPSTVATHSMHGRDDGQRPVKSYWSTG